MIPSELNEVLSSDPEILAGIVCYRGTRVPVETFFDYQADGISLDRFLHGFPTVTRDQALAVIRWQTEQARRQVARAS
jgi:uncharacterized protein (DUF433 family)